MTLIDRDEASQDHLLEATPETTALAPAHGVPASLDALLDLHGSDPALDSRRWTSAAARRARQARVLRDCHAGLAPVLAVATAALVGADPLRLAVGAVAGSLAAIAKSHRALPGGQPVSEALAGTAFAVTLSALVAALPSEALPIGGVTLAGGSVLAAVVAIGAALQVTVSLSMKPVLHPRVARICAVVAAVGAVLAI